MRAFQPADVPLDDLQAVFLVAGYGAEDDLRGDVVQVVPVAADASVRVPVGLCGLLQPAGVQVGQQQLGQDPVRLLVTAAPGHRRPDLDRLLVPAQRGQVFDLARRYASSAVGQAVAAGG